MADKLIDTPYGRKTPEMLCKAMDAYEVQPQLLAALREIADYDDRAVIENDAGDALRHMARVALSKIKL